MAQEQDFSDADFGEDYSPILMGWNVTEKSYTCCICHKRFRHRLRGPAFFRVMEDKKLKPVCFECVEKRVGDVITSDEDLRGRGLAGLPILFKLTERIRTSEGGDLMTLAELTGWCKALARKMTE